MSSLFSQINFEQYWSMQVVEANIVVFLNLLGALGLGLILGYERSFHGRAAGMRTYSLVCLASAGLTVIIGYSGLWFGGHNHEMVGAGQIIQGIITGVGFLGAGVIIKEGYSISGLTTAASIWSAAAVGILIGVGFYMSAMLLSVLSAMVMMWVSKLEAFLPSRHAIAITLKFHRDYIPNEDEVDLVMLDLGYETAKGSFAITSDNNKEEWHFSAVALLNRTKFSIPRISRQIVKINGLESYKISFARN
jgi:putative Mg2+ transporter-C (MgtC) family protein